MIRLLVFASMWLTIAVHSSAKFKLVGRIVEGKSNVAVEYANIQLLKVDSTFVKGVISGNNGDFVIDELEKGDFILCVTCMGYENTYVSISNLDTNRDIGKIVMYNSSVTLDDITVTANSVIRKSDMQILFPTKVQRHASTNGLTLLRNLQLSRVIVNSIDNTIKVSSGGDVQLRINGVEVTQAEIIALKPDDVIKVNYYDNPGLRYGNVGAVLDYITKKKEHGGNISMNSSNGLSNTGYGENNFVAKYNHNKSEFSTTMYWGRRDLEWTRENHEKFNNPNNLQSRIEIGSPTKVKYDDLNVSLNYNWEEKDKYLFNVRFRNSFNNTPNSISDRISTIYQEKNELSVWDKTSTKINIPSLDMYLQTKLKNSQQLIFNAVGTYLNTKNERTYQEKSHGILATDIYSKIKGEKYSFISEVIYEKGFSKGKFSSGVKHSQSYLKNRYTGTIQESIGMNVSDTYAYIEYSSNMNKLDYALGLGGMRTYNSQGGNKNENYILRPNLRVSYNLKENLFFRYNGYISAYTPSLSDLNNISQVIDSFQIRKGNPELKSVKYFSNDFTMSWYGKKLGVEFFIRYSYDHKPVMENTYLENGKFIRTTDNHKSFHRLNLQTSIQILPYKEYLLIKIIPFMNRYISNGNTYTHTYTNWGIRGSLMAMYKNWALTADMNSSNQILWGETITKEEKSHSINVGYNKDKWSMSIGVLNPFTKRYEMEIENKSSLAPYLQKAYSTKLNPLFIMNFTVNLDFGRSYKAKEKRVNNEDSDSGILSGKK